MKQLGFCIKVNPAANTTRDYDKIKRNVWLSQACSMMMNNVSSKMSLIHLVVGK